MPKEVSEKERILRRKLASHSHFFLGTYASGERYKFLNYVGSKKLDIHVSPESEDLLDFSQPHYLGSFSTRPKSPYNIRADFARLRREFDKNLADLSLGVKSVELKVELTPPYGDVHIELLPRLETQVVKQEKTIRTV